jgi:hypothetical protein
MTLGPVPTKQWPIGRHHRIVPAVVLDDLAAAPAKRAEAIATVFRLAVRHNQRENRC